MARAFPDPDELVFKEDYQKFTISFLEVSTLNASSAFLCLCFKSNTYVILSYSQITALVNNLIAQYDRKLKLKLADRDAFKNLSASFDQVVRNYEELKQKNVRLEKEAETHQAEVASLNDEVARLGKREVELMGEVTKLQADLIAAWDHKEKKCSRFWNDRAAKVARTTQKA